MPSFKWSWHMYVQSVSFDPNKTLVKTHCIIYRPDKLEKVYQHVQRLLSKCVIIGNILVRHIVCYQSFLLVQQDGTTTGLLTVRPSGKPAFQNQLWSQNVLVKLKEKGKQRIKILFPCWSPIVRIAPRVCWKHHFRNVKGNINALEVINAENINLCFCVEHRQQKENMGSKDKGK